MKRLPVIAGFLSVLVALIVVAQGTGETTNPTIAQLQELESQPVENGTTAEEVPAETMENTTEGTTESNTPLPSEPTTPVVLEEPEIVFPPLTFAEFTDIEEGAWYVPYARAMVELGIVTGYRDGEGEPLGLFGPNDPVTIGQLLKMSMEAAGIDTVVCSDPQAEATIPIAWVAPYVVCAAQMNIRILQRRVLLDRPILRGEAVGLIHDVFQHVAPQLPHVFSDIETHPYRHDISYDAARHIISGPTDRKGKPTGVFLPNNILNRAEASKILFLTIHADELSGHVGLNPVTLDLFAKNYSFSPSTLVVQRGQKVTMNIHNEDRHSFNIDELNIHKNLIDAEETITFTPSESGTFNYYCDLTGHTAAGMIGQLVVK